MDINTIGQLLSITLIFSTAYIFTALGGIVSERAGVINIGLEGLMVAGAFAAAVGTLYAEDAGMGGAAPWVGLLAGMLFGVLFSVIHAVASITFKADQVVSGVVINFLAGGVTLYLVKLLFEGSGQTETIKNGIGRIRIPYLEDIPIIGQALFNTYATTYIALLLVFVLWYVLFRTPFGLRLRAVGEHPSAADTVGVKVQRMRYIAVLISGALGGLGGATITLTTTDNFAHNTISGQGFIALAALIFGKWNPIGALGAALFFGFTQGALKNFMQLFEFSKQIPAEFIYMLPYILTIVVLVGAVGRAKAPSALGEPYDPGKR
ncbi:ABC transporter permease [Paenibacillus gansuensis]|uniref:ABC transporter permease n=1 Tax=Paenibacillus gansuensis TaxID=306542 RepID=A0ABW5PD43_9BACL